MKICFLNDTHFGIRGDSQIFFDYSMKFFDEVLFPYLDENNIKTIIHAGDLMDRRKFVNFNILHQIRERFITKLHDRNINFHCILGNHDVYYKNTNRVNSIKELFGDDITIYDTPTVVDFDGLKLALLPWVNKENYDNSLKFIKTASAPILVGHLELDGYEVLRGIKHQGGMNSSLFDRYEKVFSGHFHCKQSRHNVYYLGTQYQMTFSDIAETKGFHVFNTEDRNIDFIKNPHNMFHVLRYDDNDGPHKVTNMNFEYLENCYVKLYIDCRKHPNSFDQFLEKMYSFNPADVNIIENFDDSDPNDKELVDLGQDTITLINNEINSSEEIYDKDKMKKIIKDLYMESLSI
jgi:DNA repair exonuclease SbcCD nuclease subunit